MVVSMYSASGERAPGRFHAPSEYDDFLRSVLEDGPLPVADLIVGANSEGLNYKGLQRAAKRLGVVARGQMREREWAIPDAKGQVSEWAKGQSECSNNEVSEYSGPGVRMGVRMPGALTGHTRAYGQPPYGHLRRGPGEDDEEAKGHFALYQIRMPGGRLSPFLSRRSRDWSQVVWPPEGFVHDQRHDAWGSTLWNFVGEAMPASPVPSTVGVCWSCGFGLGSKGRLVHEPDDSRAWVAECGECPDSNVTATPVTDDTRYWDGHSWVRYGDFGKPTPLIDNVSSRLGAIQQNYEEGATT